MKYVLDTNTLSLLMAGDPSVSERLLAQARTDVLLPQPVVAEVAYGLARLASSKRRRRLEQRFDLFLEELPRAAWTDEVSRAFGRVKADLERRGESLEDFDVAVAAHALALDATLVTDDLDHMKRVRELKLTNWRARPASPGL